MKCATAHEGFISFHVATWQHFKMRGAALHHFKFCMAKHFIYTRKSTLSGGFFFVFYTNSAFYS
jgi:hypothetical protein